MFQVMWFLICFAIYTPFTVLFLFLGNRVCIGNRRELLCVSCYALDFKKSALKTLTFWSLQKWQPALEMPKFLRTC